MKPAQIKYYKDLLLIEILRMWTFAGETLCGKRDVVRLRKIRVKKEDCANTVF